MFLDYLFFRLLAIGVYEKSYWAKIFITCIEAIALDPIVRTLINFYVGCNGSQNAFYFSALLLLIFNSIYYSPSTIRRLREKYQNETLIVKITKLLFIVVVLVATFMYADDLVLRFIEAPPC
jgi:hypothetical protein